MKQLHRLQQAWKGGHLIFINAAFLVELTQLEAATKYSFQVHVVHDTWKDISQQIQMCSEHYRHTTLYTQRQNYYRLCSCPYSASDVLWLQLTWCSWPSCPLSSLYSVDEPCMQHSVAPSSQKPERRQVNKITPVYKIKITWTSFSDKNFPCYIFRHFSWAV